MTKTEFVGVRVTPNISHNLDKVAARHGISRSILIRELLENCDPLYNILKAEREKKQKDRETIENELSIVIGKKLPKDLTPVMAEMMGEIMKTVMQQVAEKLTARKEPKIKR